MWRKAVKRITTASPAARRAPREPASDHEPFTRIYEANLWRRGSGVGSMPEFTKPYVAFLQEFLREHDIHSVVDVGCGDWQFSRLIDWSGVRYLGLDVVEPLVAANRERFASATVSFAALTEATELPPADLVLCKDVFQHLPLADVHRYLEVFEQRFEYVLITNDVYPDEGTNADIAPGGYRAIRPDLEPFGERCALLLEWDVTAFGSYWIKHTYQLPGNGAAALPVATVDPILLSAAQRNR